MGQAARWQVSSKKSEKAGDVARFVKEEEAVVHRFEDEVQFLVFRAGLFDSARKAGRQAVQRGDEDVEFVAGVQEDAAREVVPKMKPSLC